MAPRKKGKKGDNETEAERVAGELRELAGVVDPLGEITRAAGVIGLPDVLAKEVLAATRTADLLGTAATGVDALGLDRGTLLAAESIYRSSASAVLAADASRFGLGTNPLLDSVKSAMGPASAMGAVFDAAGTSRFGLGTNPLLESVKSAMGPASVVFDAGTSRFGLGTNPLLESVRGPASSMGAVFDAADASRFGLGTNPLLESVKSAMGSASITEQVLGAARFGAVSDSIFGAASLGTTLNDVVDRFGEKYPRATMLARDAAEFNPAGRVTDCFGPGPAAAPLPATTTKEGRDARLVALEAEAAKRAKELEKQLADVHAKLDTAKKHNDELRANLVELESNLEAQDRLKFLLNRVHATIYERLTGDAIAHFRSDAPQVMYVMSVDIRRSTELMLKAKTPHNFAYFITTLCKELAAIVRDCYGVIDKFTGDGILCHFPLFVTGKGAGLNAVVAANRCHEAFTRQYDNSRSLFEVVPTEVGLGIGIDFGPCHFVEVSESLTVVGRPVVYACRFAGGEGGATLLNQSARDAVAALHATEVRLTEGTIGIKHEGRSLAYAAQLVDSQCAPIAPEWLAAGASSVAAAPAR